MHHSTRPATDVPEMGKEGGWDLPPGGRGDPSPQGGRGWEIKPICRIFPCIFDFVSSWVCCICAYIVFILIMLDSFMLHCIEYGCCPNILLLSMCILHSTMFRLIRPG